jgi:hypothetical protein
MAFLVLVALKVTVSPGTGRVSADQFAGVDQLLSAPPPSHVLVAAMTRGANAIAAARTTTIPRGTDVARMTPDTSFVIARERSEEIPA